MKVTRRSGEPTACGTLVGVAKQVQDRYRAGGRRTSAEPLRASWRPTEDGEAPRGRKSAPRKKGLRRLISTYGWRIYALPILVAVTALVLMDTTGEDGTDARADQAGVVGPGANDPAQSPVVTESPAVPPDLNIPTAELPGGPDYLQTGGGNWTVLPGRGERVGTAGELYTYTVEIEDGIDLTALGGNDSFARLVDSTLAEARGWTSTGQVSLQRVDGDEEPDIRISLSTPDTVHRPDYCGFSIKYESSCWRRSEQRVMINLARWMRGALAFGGDIGSYRSYAINHEIGHAFGRGHVGCENAGELAPVMMQQSFGVANDFVAQLNDQAGNSDPVTADGKTCQYNAWPNPQAQPGG